MCACTVWIEMQVFCTNHYLTEAGGKVWGCGTVWGELWGGSCVWGAVGAVAQVCGVSCVEELCDEAIGPNSINCQ